MLRRLDIHGFRGFATLSAELGPVSVLLGPNSSGKSSVLQAVRLACTALAWTLQQAPVPKIDGEWIVIWWDWPIREDAASEILTVVSRAIDRTRRSWRSCEPPTLAVTPARD